MLSGTTCSVCDSGTYAATPTSTTCTSKALVITFYLILFKDCPGGCEPCTSPTACQTCPAGFVLTGSTCGQCASGTYSAGLSCNSNLFPDMFLDINFSQDCPNGCATCTSASSCQSCTSGYELKIEDSSCILSQSPQEEIKVVEEESDSGILSTYIPA